MLKRTLPLVAIVAFIVCWLSLRVGAQGGAGYVKISGPIPITATSYTDSSVVDGASYQYEITGVNSLGESGPSGASIVATIPAAGSHSTTVTWGAVAVDTGYNVYRFLVSTPPVPPAQAPAVVVN